MIKNTFPNLKCGLCLVLTACLTIQFSFAKTTLKKVNAENSIISPVADGVKSPKTSIKLTNFSIIVQSNQTILSWSAIEGKNGKYLVYKSDDNRNFAKINERVISNNTKEPSLYIIHDEEPSKGLNYYRLVYQDIEVNQKEIASKVVYLGTKEPIKLSVSSLPRINRI